MSCPQKTRKTTMQTVTDVHGTHIIPAAGGVVRVSGVPDSVLTKTPLFLDGGRLVATVRYPHNGRKATFFVSQIRP